MLGAAKNCTVNLVIVQKKFKEIQIEYLEILKIKNRKITNIYIYFVFNLYSLKSLGIQSSARYLQSKLFLNQNCLTVTHTTFLFRAYTAKNLT